MANTERIKILCAHLRPAETFADVGCDHGYMSEIGRASCRERV